MKIRDLVDVVAQPTVVRLDHLQGKDAGWISTSYCVTEEAENQFRSLRALLAQKTGCGVFLIGHYGSGKSHFLAYLTQQIRAGSFGKGKPEVAALSLLNYKAAQSLESILGEELGISSGKSDRREAWRELEGRHPDGLILILDELSEFLRSKPAPQSFNEDLRVLQFMGEWAQEHRLWIVAALQEQIEHTGEIEYDLFRKIKDRYPVRLLLTGAHVKDLISGRILRKKPEYGAAVEKLARELRHIYPESSMDYGAFCELYPIHPMTLELLEEVRDRFSMARGIVDFTLTRLRGDEARGAAPFLDRPWGHLLTPDAIVDHFADLFEVQPEFIAIAQKVLPFYRKHIPALFEGETQRALAWRLLKLLILVHLSPGRDALHPDDASLWLLLKVSSIDPAKNREIVRRALETMCAQGSYLKRQGDCYRLDLQDDSKEYLDQLLAKAVEELKARGDYAFELLLPSLDQAEFNPLSMPRDRWHVRRVRWHFHERELNVYLGGGVPPEWKGLALQIGLPWGPAAEAAGCHKILPRPIEMTPDLLELAALYYLKERPLPARVAARIQERIAARGAPFRAMVRTAYHEAAVLDPEGNRGAPPLAAMQSGTAGWLNAYGESVLRQTYPLFERFAPIHGPLPKEAYRQFMKFASDHDLGAELAPEYVKLIREAYLVPMGLLHRRGSDYVLAPKLDSHDLVRLLAPVLAHHPAPARVYQHLRAPVYGLVDDQIHLLLVILLIQGEIDIVKGERSYRETCETLPNPLQYDRILPGRALNLTQLRDLQALCEGFQVPVPKQWSVLTQRRAVEQLRKFGRRQRDLLGDFVIRLRASEEGEEVAARFEALIARWLALEHGDHELQGFEHFLFAIGSAPQFIAEHTELAALPARYDRVLRESARFRHLFGYPCLSQCAEPEIAARVEALGAPPPLARAADLESWLSRAQELYQRYAAWYRERHEHWRSEVNRHAIWTYRAPGIASSRNVGADGLVRELEALGGEARGLRCAGLSPLDFQPLCRCGFDGTEGPIQKILARFEAAVNNLEKELNLFFQSDKVKSRVREWVEQKIEVTPGTLSYLEGKAVCPQIENIPLFDQHLSGLELVQTIEPGALVDLLADRVWEKTALMKAVGDFFDRFGPRVTLRREEAPARREMVAWCCEQALRHGCALPPGLTAAEQALIPGAIDPRWVSEASLRNLEGMGWRENAIERILELLLDGVIRAPENPPVHGPVAAALELLRPTPPAGPAGLAGQARTLYREHARFLRLRPKPWLARLRDLAERPLADWPESLEKALEAFLDHHWVVVDCLGLPLLDATAALLPEAFPGRKLERVEFAAVSEKSSTDAFYLGLVGRDFRKALEKVNVVDDLIHGRKLGFGDLERLARAELEIAFRKLRARLDPSAPLIVFGDHGFRLLADGSGFSHGGPSTLERLVPIVVLSRG